MNGDVNVESIYKKCKCCLFFLFTGCIRLSRGIILLKKIGMPEGFLLNQLALPGLYSAKHKKSRSNETGIIFYHHLNNDNVLLQRH
jgi:hypothetical protein